MRRRRIAALPAVLLAGLCPGGLPVAAAAASGAPRLPARAYVLIDAGTGQELAGLDSQRELAIASTTKLMTALLTLESVPLTRILTEPDYHPAPADSQIGLVPGERMSVRDLLVAMLLPSADDAAEDLAYNLGNRSVAAFVARMNARAAALGLRHTHYSTPIGLDTPGNYSTATDLSRLAAYVLAREPFFAHTVAIPRALLRTGNSPRLVINRNDLVGRYPWIDGVKTGHTLDAGYVLVASARQNGLHLISAVLGTPSEAARDEATLALLRYGLANFRRVDALRRGEVLARVSVVDQAPSHALLLSATPFSATIPRSARITLRVRAPARVNGPRARGSRIGEVLVLSDGRPLARIPLLLARSIPAVGELTRIRRFLLRGTTLAPLVAVVAAALLLSRRRGRRRAAR